jgi:3-oxoacyl-[acyl-carrier protein] reductase
MITVIEQWFLRPEFVERGTQVMQEMDDIVGPGAHDDPAWSGHAKFYHSRMLGNKFLMIYPWRSVEDHEELRVREEPLLKDFFERYCERNREISYYDELAVDVEHDHHGE